MFPFTGLRRLNPRDFCAGFEPNHLFAPPSLKFGTKPINSKFQELAELIASTRLQLATCEPFLAASITKHIQTGEELYEQAVTKLEENHCEPAATLAYRSWTYLKLAERELSTARQESKLRDFKKDTVEAEVIGLIDALAQLKLGVEAFDQTADPEMMGSLTKVMEYFDDALTLLEHGMPVLALVNTSSALILLYWVTLHLDVSTAKSSTLSAIMSESDQLQRDSTRLAERIMQLTTANATLALAPDAHKHLARATRNLLLTVELTANGLKTEAKNHLDAGTSEICLVEELQRLQSQPAEGSALWQPDTAQSFSTEEASLEKLHDEFTIAALRARRYAIALNLTVNKQASLKAILDRAELILSLQS